ncbi:WD40 repeat-like protein [Ascobolus immersus RN42]|uniref:WD40 repeat-like protein n=1 Tax=Ascobolus immersus RN42 TaxID=1160509 RepID=A0A3N4IDG4_ASCIM|nr:WD40 repeat-like protein [Ascobolus immersus RN42]
MMMSFPPPTAPRLGGPNSIDWRTGTVAGTLAQPVIETHNTIAHPTGPEYQFSVGEGTYTLREDIMLATPPPHPHEIPQANPNPLATAPAPPTTGTKITPVIISRVPAPPSFNHIPNPSAESLRGSADGDGNSDNGSLSGRKRVVSTFGGGCVDAPAEKMKQKKPKNSIGKTGSSFVSRIVSHQNLNQRLQERKTDGLYVFANINRALLWLDMSSPNKQEQLSKIQFMKAHPLCHDVNFVTRSTTHLDVVAGFSSGDIIWFDPMTNKYSRINKKHSINSSPVLEIKWLPGSENLFLAAHADGTIIVYDKEKEDPLSDDQKPSEKEKDSKKAAQKLQRQNPVARWPICRQPINQVSFSPDSQHLAVVSEDGCLRIFKLLRDSIELLDTYNSYYGALLCVCWSPDGRYILTGGQDDLVTIWSFAEKRIVARCQGHHSWVTSVAFDPWRCDERTYRFGSVGEDCRLLLWDFSVGMLHRPKAIGHNSRGSISSAVPGNNVGSSANRARTTTLDSGRFRSDSSLPAFVAADGEGAVPPSNNHPVESRARTAVLPPIMSKMVDPEPLSQIVFMEDSIVITCKDGHIRTWDRPSNNINASQITLPVTN